MITGLVYKVVDVCESDKILYVGSTEKTLARRWYVHKSDAKRRTTKWYTYLREQGAEHFQILPLERLDCETREDLFKLEEVYSKAIQPPFNMIRCHRTDEEEKEYQAKYHKENKEKLLVQRAKYNSERVICDCGCEVTRGGLTRHRKNKLHKKCMSLKFVRANLARGAFLTCTKPT